MTYTNVMVSFEYNAVFYAGFAMEAGVDYKVVTTARDGIPPIFHFTGSDMADLDQPKIAAGGWTSQSTGTVVPANFLVIPAA